MVRSSSRPLVVSQANRYPRTLSTLIPDGSPIKVVSGAKPSSRLRLRQQRSARRKLKQRRLRPKRPKKRSKKRRRRKKKRRKLWLRRPSS